MSNAENEARRQRQLEALEQAAGSWKDEHHPELKSGSGAWLKKIREESERRLTRQPCGH